MFRIVQGFNRYGFHPIIHIIGEISLEAMTDMNVQGVSNDDVKMAIIQQLFEAIDNRDKVMNLENVDIEKKWTDYKELLNEPLFEPELVKIFKEMGLITTETDMGGNYISLTQKGRDTK